MAQMGKTKKETDPIDLKLRQIVTSALQHEIESSEGRKLSDTEFLEIFTGLEIEDVEGEPILNC